MMTDLNIKVLSIDPCQAPAGALNTEVTLQFMRRRGIARSVVANRNARVADSLFGASASKGASLWLLAFRVVFGVALMLLGLNGLSVLPIAVDGRSAMAEPIAWCAVGAGAITILGLFNRFLGILASVASIMMLIAIPSVSAMIISGGALAGFLLIAISGPGRYATDFFIQRLVSRRLSRPERSGIDLNDYRAYARL